MEYSGMKEIVWGVWKERENMNADMKWLDNPEVFKVNQLEAHSDHCYYLDYSDMKKEKNPLLQSLNGQWEFAYSKNVMERPVDFYKETLMHQDLIKLWFRDISNWLDMIKSVTSTRCIRGKEKSIIEEPTAWRALGKKRGCFQRQNIIL